MADKCMNMFRRFSEIDDGCLFSDKHIHTCFVDGEGTIADIVREASNRGLKQVAITDHMRRDSVYSRVYFDAIDKYAVIPGIKVLKGFEAKIIDFSGNIDISEDVLREAEISIASVHRFPIGRKLYSPFDFNKKLCQEIELELTLAAVNNARCKVIGHPGGMSLRTYGEFPTEFFEEIIQACYRNDVAFEINGAYHSGVSRQLVGILKKIDSFVSFGSDAHTLDRIGDCLQDVWRAHINVKS